MINKINQYIDELRINTVGNPKWNIEISKFDYEVKDIKLVCILKLVRIGQGCNSISKLLEEGLFVDANALVRSVFDSILEVFFLLEKYPNTTPKVDKFVLDFYSRKVDGTFTIDNKYISMKNIIEGMAKAVCNESNNEIVEMANKITKIYSGYIHVGYSNILEMYGGYKNNLSFNMNGIKIKSVINKKKNIMNSILLLVKYSTIFAARKFDQNRIADEICKLLTNASTL